MLTCTYVQALQFSGCDNLQLAGLTHVNSPKNHISIDSCNGVAVSDLYITAPESSPNTDGIDIASSSNVFIDRLKIATGTILHHSLYINVIMLIVKLKDELDFL